MKQYVIIDKRSKKAQKEEGEAYISIVLFDNQSEVLYDRVPVGKVEPMNDNEDSCRIE